MKFRFTNKTLLSAAAAGVLACNLAAPHVTVLPLLWAICFVEGICKIQGTFECMSNIQLWMTPKRDFTVFFPMLHIVILGSMQVSDLLATHLMYHYHWTYMHWFVAGGDDGRLLVITVCTRHFRIVKKFPLFGIDWLGGLLWALLLLEVAFFFCYGDWYDWWNSPAIRVLAAVIVLTLCVCAGRMLHVRHPFLEPKMWTYRNLLPVLALITLVEAFLATEHVLEEVFYEDVMHYEALVSVRLDWLVLAGAVAGCLFACWWMHVRRFSYLRLIAVGIAFLTCYLVGFLLYAFCRHPHFAALFAGGVPRICIRGVECDVYGLSGRNHDIPALFSSLERVQYAAHGGGRSAGGCHLYRSLFALRVGQSGTLRFGHRPCVFRMLRRLCIG